MTKDRLAKITWLFDYKYDGELNVNKFVWSAWLALAYDGCVSWTGQDHAIKGGIVFG